MLKLNTWQTPASCYPDQRLGRARIKTIRYRGLHECYGLHGYRHYQARNLKIKQLLIDNQTWMVDDPPHWWAMQQHANFYQGHVLVAGLGLGLILYTLAKNPDVRKITVVEREKDVINLVAPYIPACEIIHGDFWDYKGPDPDGVFFDLFVGNGHDLLPAALRTYVELVEWFPGRTIRIHGFNNNYLKEFGDLVSVANTRGGTRASLPRTRLDK